MTRSGLDDNETITECLPVSIPDTGTSEGSIADATPANWVDRYAPAALRPYGQLARLDRPIGAMLLLWPCWWAAALVANETGAAIPDPWHLFLFFIGAFAMRGAGCTYNDLVDRDLDAQVERTRLRPIASGRISVTRAIMFMAAQGLVGLIVLLQFNRFSIILGLCSLIVIAIYPFMKRITHWPQSVLGLAFSWGALMGWSATFARLDWPAAILFLGTFFWIMAYDTVYALQDREDDSLIGIGSTALLFGDTVKGWIGGFFALSLVLLAIAGWLGGAGLLYLATLAGGAAYMGVNFTSMAIDTPAECLREFKRNNHFGWIVFGGFVADALLERVMS